MVGEKHWTPPPRRNSTDTFNTVRASTAELMYFINWSQKKSFGCKEVEEASSFLSSWKDLTVLATASASAIVYETAAVAQLSARSLPSDLRANGRAHFQNLNSRENNGSELPK